MSKADKALANIGKGRGRGRKYDGNKVIRFLEDKNGVPYGPNNNPKREKTKAHVKFGLLRDGMTVDEAREVFKPREKELGATADGELGWCLKHHFLKLEDPIAAESEDDTQEEEAEEEVTEETVDVEETAEEEQAA